MSDGEAADEHGMKLKCPSTDRYNSITAISRHFDAVSVLLPRIASPAGLHKINVNDTRIRRLAPERLCDVDT